MAPRMRQEESWSSVHRSEASGTSNDDFNYPSDISMRDENDMDEVSLSQARSAPTSTELQKFLHPLRVTADRVGKQVEQFAESLDRFETKISRDSPQGAKDCRLVLPLVQKYRKIASDTVKHLRVIHGSDRQRPSQYSSRASSRLKESRPGSLRHSGTNHESHTQALTDVEDLRHWEQEEQTWDLFESMIQLEFPVPQDERSEADDAGIARPKLSSAMHVYSTEKEIWTNFLATDDLAWERKTVVAWLERTADKSSEDIDHLIEHLESDADRGAGIVAHSWLYTREAIKNQKRLRTWPRAFEPDEPGLDSSLMNSNHTDSLVTQLDPDAFARQSRALEDQDLSFERAVWLACWEMLRRGKSWQFIRDWCAEKVEFWRAAVIHPNPNLMHDAMEQEPDWQSQHLWRKTCATLAKDGGINEYERAVHGLLSGYLPGVLKVGRSWHDQVFAHYSSYLIHAFERHLKSNFASRIPQALTAHESLFNFSTFAGQRAFSGNQLVEKLKMSEETKHEATEPFTMLQGSLIAGSFDDFVFKQGIRLCQIANSTETSKILPDFAGVQVETHNLAQITTNDFDFLRIVSHMILIYQYLDRQCGSDDRQVATECFIVAYVDYLSKAGKQQLLPLYASRLSHERSIACLGRQLPFVQEETERSTILKLMKQLKFDIPGVLSMQLRLITADAPPEHLYVDDFPTLAILENIENTAIRIPPIASKFLGNDISADHLNLIKGYKWYKLLEGHWHQTMAVGVMIYKYLLRCRAHAAAVLMADELSLSVMSLSKTPALLGLSVDLTEQQDYELDYVAEDDENYETAILTQQAQSFLDFENLFVALRLMQEWVEKANGIQEASR